MATHEGSAPRVAAQERTMVRVRWAGIAFGLLQFSLYSPPEGTVEPPLLRPLGYLVLAALGFVQLTTIVALRRGPSRSRLQRMGAMNFASDAAAIWALVWLFNFEPAGTTWVIITFACLEGALRYGLRGAMTPVAVAAMMEPLRDLYRQAAFGYEFQIDSVTFRVGVMGIIALVAGMMSRDLSRERERAERRARLLSTVSAAGRTMSTLDHDAVLESVVAATGTLGFEAAELCMFDEGTASYRVRHPRGLPEAYVHAPQPIDSGVAGMVRRARETVVLEDYEAFARGIPMVQRLGFHAVIATPVWSGGELAAALIAGTHEVKTLESEEIEAFELLAAHAGRAHENARRFEDERRAVERLAELDRMKREFLSMVSHELRTPLTAIEGMGLTLELSWDKLDDDTRRQLLSRVNANSRTLDGIISSLLDFSRLEAGRLEVHPEPLDVGLLVRSVTGRLSGLFSDHHLVVEAQDGLTVAADGMLMDRVVENLLSNAAKHTPKGTLVRASAAAEGARVVVAVVDAGPGIDPRDMEHVGERFYRGGDPNHRNTKGIGLGLALAREILELHGGRLEVSSTLGEGASFSFSLPFSDQPGPEGLATQRPAAASQ